MQRARHVLRCIQGLSSACWLAAGCTAHISFANGRSYRKEKPPRSTTKSPASNRPYKHSNMSLSFFTSIIDLCCMPKIGKSGSRLLWDGDCLTRNPRRRNLGCHVSSHIGTKLHQVRHQLNWISLSDYV